jgi:hypothetical protein
VRGKQSPKPSFTAEARHEPSASCRERTNIEIVASLHIDAVPVLRTKSR